MTGEEIDIFDQSRLLTAEDVAGVLGVKPKTIYKWVYEKRIPFIKLGHGKGALVMFNPKRLNYWLKELSHEPLKEEKKLERTQVVKKAHRETVARYEAFMAEM